MATLRAFTFLYAAILLSTIGLTEARSFTSFFFGNPAASIDTTTTTTTTTTTPVVNNNHNSHINNNNGNKVIVDDNVLGDENDDGDIVLTNGVTVEANVTGNSRVYFKADNLVGDGEVLISVTALSGDPDLFVSTEDNHPNGINAMWTSMGWGGEELRINTTSTGPFYITVLAFGGDASLFRITVSRGPFQTLQSGKPSVGSVGVGHMQFYKFEFDENKDHVTVVASAETYWGLRMYVSGKKSESGDAASFYRPGTANAGSYDWHSSYDLPRRIVANKGDNGFCGGAHTAGEKCALYITVYGSSYMRNDTTFTITAAEAGATVTLQQGVTIYDIVPRNDEDYFDIYIDKMRDVSISLTAISGNPNLYVTTDAKPGKPGPGNSLWSSSFYGTDSIEIPTTHRDFCYNCMYHIGVGGTANAFFTITAGFSANFTTLIPGVPLSSSIEASKPRHYRLYAEGSHKQNIEFTATAVHGTVPVVRVSTKGYPTSINSEFYAIGLNGVARVLVRPEHPSACINCFYYLTITEHDNKPMNFTVMGTPSTETVTLQDGVPQQGEVARHQYVYYAIQLNSVSELTISVSPTHGDPDLYVSRAPLAPNDGGTRRPKKEAGKHTWASMGTFSDEVTIPAEECNGRPCQYFIGVYGFRTASFTIVAAHANTTVELTPGEVYTASSPAHEERYYAVEVGEVKDHITFTMSPTKGWPRMYISTRGIPTKTDKNWYAVGYPAVKRVVPADIGFCERCTYYIMIVSQFTNTSYSLQVGISDEGVMLQTGVPTYGEIPGRGMVYYQATFSGEMDVVIDVTPYGGDPDLYVSKTVTHPGPGADKHTWSGISFGGDKVIIKKKDVKPGDVFYIGVRSYQVNPLRFTITASEEDTPLMLHEGTPLQDSIAYNETRHIRMSIDREQLKRISATVVPSRGVPSLYMSTTGYPVPGNTTTYSWHTSHGNPVVVTAAEGDKGWCKSWPCLFYFTVTAREGSHSGLAYTIQASGAGRAITLTPGRPQIDSAQGHTYRYYTYYPVSDTDDVRVSVSRIEGDPDVYISRDFWNPRRDNYTWRAMTYGDDVITITSDDPKRCRENMPNCAYHIGVRNFDATETATYTITVVQGKIVTDVISGVPFDDEVYPNANGGLHMYRLHVSNMVQDHIQFMVTPWRGVPDLYVVKEKTRNDSNPQVIDPKDSNTYDFKSTRGPPVAVAIHDGFCSGCDYLVGVGAHENSTGPVRFTLLASASNDTVTLRPQIPQYGSVAPGSYAYYQVQFSEPGKDIVISVTALAGRVEDPDIFLGCYKDFPRPTIADHDPKWAGMYAGADTVVIRSEDMCKGDNNPLMIAVTDIMDWSREAEIVTFIVTARMEDGYINLQPGLPSTGTTSSGAAQRFLFHVDDDSQESRIPIDKVSFAVTPDSVSSDEIFEVYISTMQDQKYDPTGPPPERVVPVFPDPNVESSYNFSEIGEPSVIVNVQKSGPARLRSGGRALGKKSKQVTAAAGEPVMSKVRSRSRKFVVSGRDVMRSNGKIALRQAADGDGDGDDNFFCTGCSYLILVTTTSEATDFTITAWTSQGSLALQTGVPFPGTTRVGETVRFVFIAPEITANVTITATPLSGDASMTVMLDESPLIFTIDSLRETETLTIDKKEVTKYCSADRGSGCRFLIEIEGVRDGLGPLPNPSANSTSGSTDDIVPFIITATLVDDTILLTPGDPIDVSFSEQTERHFRIIVPTGRRNKLAKSKKSKRDAAALPEDITITAIGIVEVTVYANADNGRDGDANASPYPSTKNSQWQSEKGTPAFLTIRGTDLGEDATMIYLTVKAAVATGSSSVLITAAWESTLVQLREGMTAYVAVEGKESGHVGNFKASFAESTGTADRIIYGQALSGSADIYAGTKRNPSKDNYESSWKMQVTSGEKEDEPGLRKDIVIVTESDPCLKGECREIFASAYPTSTELLKLAVTAVTKGEAETANPARKYIVGVKKGDGWSIWRFKPFERTRLLKLVVEIETEDAAVVVYSTKHASPPQSLKAADLEGYTMVTSTEDLDIAAPAQTPIYVFVGPGTASSENAVEVDFTMIDSTDYVKPSPGTSNPDDTKNDKGGLSGKTVAILIVSSIFGLVFLVGCCVFVSRMENIRKIYSRAGKAQYSEVMT